MNVECEHLATAWLISLYRQDIYFHIVRVTLDIFLAGRGGLVKPPLKFSLGNRQTIGDIIELKLSEL